MSTTHPGRSVWEQAADRLAREQALPPRSWPLDDTDVPVIGQQVLGDHPGMAWALRPGSEARPANGTDLAKYARQRGDLAWAAANGDPYCVLPVPELPPLDLRPVPQHARPALEAVPCPRPAAAVARLAAQAHGLGDLDRELEARFTAFDAAHDAQDEHEATRQIPAVDAITTTTPAITGGGN